MMDGGMIEPEVVVLAPDAEQLARQHQSPASPAIDRDQACFGQATSASAGLSAPALGGPEGREVARQRQQRQHPDDRQPNHHGRRSTIAFDGPALSAGPGIARNQADLLKVDAERQPRQKLRHAACIPPTSPRACREAASIVANCCSSRWASRQHQGRIEAKAHGSHQKALRYAFGETSVSSTM
jgi:hypothetical protein